MRPSIFMLNGLGDLRLLIMNQRNAGLTGGLPGSS